MKPMQDPQDFQPAVTPHQLAGPPQGYPPLPPRIVPAPPGSRYDRLARTPLHAWWRPVLGTVLVAAGFVAIGAAIVIGGSLIGLIAGAKRSDSGSQIFADPLLDLT